MIFVYILLGIAVLLLVLTLVAPRKFNVQRSISINKPLPEVFQYLKFIKNQDNWSPWSKKDPDMKKEFRGTDGEVGFVSAWEGNKHVGSGEQEIKGIIENERVDSELRFLKPFKSTNDAYLLVREIDANTTEVIWGFKGKHTPPMNIFMLFMSMEKIVGKDFEEGLADLKLILES